MNKLCYFLWLSILFHLQGYSQVNQTKIDSLFSFLSLAKEDTAKVNTLNELTSFLRYSYRGKIQAKNIGEIDMYFVEMNR